MEKRQRLIFAAVLATAGAGTALAIGAAMDNLAVAVAVAFGMAFGAALVALAPWQR